MKKHYDVLVLISLLLSITACGGGGGSGSSANSPTSVSSASLDASNQTVASQDVASMALGLFDTSSSVFGIDSPKESLLYTEAFSHLDKFPGYVTDSSANPIVAGAVESKNYNCPTSGSYTASVNDADNNSRASNGDTFSITYNSCVSGSVTLSGTLSFTITALSGTYGTAPYTLGVSMSFGNFSATSGAYSAALNGAFSVSGSKTGANAFTQTISASSLSASANYAGVTRSRSLSGFSATETRTADSTYGYITSYMMSGTLSSSGFSGTRSVSFTTPTTFQRRGGATYPYTGVMLITGASNSALKMTTVSNTQVTIELDANGDSIFESNSTVNWNTLI
jgi:hypothetical protein